MVNAFSATRLTRDDLQLIILFASYNEIQLSLAILHNRRDARGTLSCLVSSFLPKDDGNLVSIN